MPNGKPGDHPITDIKVHRIKVFSKEADDLIRKIVELGGESELEKKFNLFSPPPIHEFESSLRELYNRLHNEAKERGWEV